MTRCKIYHASINEPVFSKKWEQKLLTIPKVWQDYILKFVNQDDKKRTLLARLILLKFLDDVNFTGEKEILFNNFGKPYIKQAPYFNWSHSGDYVVFASSSKKKIGIDIEKITNIDICDFKSSFNKLQWKSIKSKEDFYKYWTINEAIVKSKGMGFSMGFKEIGLLGENNKINVSDEIFIIDELIISKKYKCHIAIPEIDYFNVNLTEFEVK